MIRTICIALYATLCLQGNTQNFESVEHSIDSILWFSPQKGHLNIVRLIDWDSRILRSIPSIPPVRPPSLGLSVSSSFGHRLHPIRGVSHLHSGIDLPPMGGNDTIYAPANGVIDTIGYNRRLGLFIEIRHPYNYKTIYGHLRAVMIKPYQEVAQGEMIAIMGNTGASTGVHLHYTIKHGVTTIDPLPYCYLLFERLKRPKKEAFRQ